MIEVVYVGGLYENTAGPELMHVLEKLYPEGRIDHYFQMRLPKSDPRTESVPRVLSESGWKPATSDKEWDKSREYVFGLHREYDSSDFEMCRLLELYVPNAQWIKDAWREDQGRIMLRGRLKKSLHFGMCIFHWYVVPDRVRRLLEKSGLKHITFRETVPMAKTDGELVHVPDWSFWGEPWWELDSDFTLPPLAPSMTFVDRQGKPLKHGDYSNGFHAKEGLYDHAELHYRESDLKGLPQFDLARTAEPFGNRQGYDPFDRPLIASKRFYDFCVENELNVDWIPVRIDPE